MGTKHDTAIDHEGKVSEHAENMLPKVEDLTWRLSQTMAELRECELDETSFALVWNECHIMRDYLLDKQKYY